MNTINSRRLPELLSPAGSEDAFRAAIEGGADAIYIGGASFNARINAQNFSPERLGECVRLAHSYGIKVYQTVNTMIFDRELKELLLAAEDSARRGIDAFIVSDPGAARLLKSYLPEIDLHASTQMSIHNTDGARLLAENGFCRVVPARELSREDIFAMVAKSPIDVEIFVHGAMCVSHSGQCLFSSLVGDRSGNRGLCAQPCRLPYGVGKQKVADKFPLSLKDMSLACHVREIINSGVASLKIEGRMKSPEYVRGVTAIWRRLLDEGRDATCDDIRDLAEIFSRGGFTDGYYKKSVGHGMLGVRSKEDKQASREAEKFHKITRKVPLDMRICLQSGQPANLTLTHGQYCIRAFGEVPFAAITAPLDESSVKKCMSKLGDTCFTLRELDIDLDSGLMLPISSLNALRRDGIKMLLEKMDQRAPLSIGNGSISRPIGKSKKRLVARFLTAKQITPCARNYFDVILLPLDKYALGDHNADGFVMPPVIFDSECGTIKSLLEKSRELNPKYAIITNLGQISAVREIFPDISLIADFRFNIANDASMCFFEDLGFESVVASAELSLPKIRDLGGSRGAIVYGRIPLMTLEKCVIKELYGDRAACDVCLSAKAQMTDRRGFVFPVIRELPHRNVVLNSLPTNMSDRQSELDRAGISDRHFIFTVEDCEQIDSVIDAFKKGIAINGAVRRI